MASVDRRERERAEMRKRILDAAREIALADGFDAVSMRRIADRIEYTAAAIYFHFDDKTSLLRELCQHDFSEFSANFASLVDIQDPVERLRGAGRVYLEFAKQHPAQYKLLFLSAVPREASENNPNHGIPERDAYAFLKVILSECVATGAFRPECNDVDMLAQLFWAGVHGLVSLQLFHKDAPWIEWRDIDQSLDALLDIQLNGVLRERNFSRPDPQVVGGA